ncbi:MAG: LCP family protein [Lachnospiraceae bacterium]|nr:LCP family protein [Lachnospiraceae bacterium]
MTFKKERAGITAILLFAQMILITFVVDAVLAREVSLSKTLLPLIVREGVLTVLLLVAAIIGYFAVPTGRKKDLYTEIAFGTEAIFWLLSAIWLGTGGVLGAMEIVLVLIVLALLVACAAAHMVLAPRKERKGKWNRLRLAVTAFDLTLLAVGFFVAIYYRNDFMRADVCIVMFILSALSILFFWWMPEKLNHAVSLGMVFIQIIVYLVCFGKLCANKELQSLFGVFFKGRGLTQVLVSIAMLMVLLLAVSILLHYLKNLQIVGKFATIAFTSLVIGLFLMLGTLQEKMGDATNINADSAVEKSQYSIFVLTDDPAQQLGDVVSYSVGYASEGRSIAMATAIEKLNEAAGTKLSLTEYRTHTELATALTTGEVRAIFMETLYAQMVDMVYEALEIEDSFTSQIREVYQLEMDAVADDPVPTGGPTPTADPENPTPTPDPAHPTGGPDRDPTKPIPFVPRADNSGRDLSKEPFTVYVSGIDTYGGISARSRSDVNLLLSVNPATKEIAIVTTPRDGYVDIPGKTTKLRDKLTHAGIYGPQYSMATLEYLYGVPVDFYIRVNFSSVEAIVDVLGGVDAYALFNFSTEDGWHFNKGLNHMNGKQALSFARERKNVSGGDYTRGKHQVELIKGLIGKMTTSRVLSNYESLLSSVSRSFQTDITLAQIAQLVSMQMSDGANWHITSYETLGHGDMRLCDAMPTDRLWVAILDEASVRKSSELLSRVLNGDYIKDGEYKYDN